MTLRQKTLLLTGGTLIAMILALYVVSSRILLGGFSAVEDKNAADSILRVHSGLEMFVEDLDTIATNYAHWNETYKFVTDRNPTYIQSTLNDETLASLRINLIAYVDNAGHVVWGSGLNREHKRLPLPRDFKSYLTPQGLLIKGGDRQNVKKGLLMLSDGPMIFVARPILRSDRTGPSRGTFIEGRFLDDERLKRLEKLVQAPLSLCAFNRRDIPADFARARSQLLASSATDAFVEPLNDQVLSGYVGLADWRKQPAVILRADLPRDATIVGWRSLNYLLISLLLVAGLVILIAALMLEHVVLSRLVSLSRGVSAITKRGKISARLPVQEKHHDELAHLSRDINQMLHSLEAAVEQQRAGDELFRQMAFNATNALYVAYPGEDRVQWYGQIDSMLGYRPDKFPRTISALQQAIHAEDVAATIAALERCLNENLALDESDPSTQYDLEYRVCRADGTYRYWIDRGKALWISETPDAPRRPVFIGACTDITEVKRTEEELAGSLSLLQATLESTADGIVVFDTAGHIENYNRQAVEMWSIPEEVLAAGNHTRLIEFASQQFADPKAYLRRVAEVHQHMQDEHFDVLHLKDGRVFERAVKPQRLGGRVVGMVHSFRDTTPREQALQAVRDSEGRLAGVVETSVDAIFLIGPDHRVQFANAAGERLLGLPRAEIAGSIYNRDVLKLLSTTGEPLPENELPVERALKSGAPVHGVECCVATPRGRRLWLSINAAPLRHGSEGEEFAGVVLSASDVTLQKALEERLAHQAFHDPLTGLPNRALFLDRLDLSLARTARSGHAVGVLFIDLDNFKFVNDSLGHSTGDQLLVGVADRLQTALRAGDTASRFGGDEFTILLDNLSDVEQAIQVAERILETLCAPLALTAREVTVTPSIGIALGTRAPKTPFEGALGEAARAGAQAEELLRNADAAMYEAKRKGRSRYAIFQSNMSANALKRLNLENDLRRALERQELVAFYQPKVVLQTGAVVGMEALIRWQHPERGLVSPLDFIPLAEETGLIVPLGWWMFEEVCRQAQSWQEYFASHPGHRVTQESSPAHSKESTPFPMVSVNVSARQLHDPDLLENMERVLRSTKILPGSLVLEITEHVVMEEAEATVGTLHALKELGLRLAIDDFGTGYSSLSYLRSFPWDFLKLDRRFVAGLGNEGGDTVIVSTMVELAHNLGLVVIAEGVETEREAARLRQMGCAMGQGYYFARPMPAAQMTDFLLSKLNEMTETAPILPSGANGPPPGEVATSGLFLPR